MRSFSIFSILFALTSCAPTLSLQHLRDRDQTVTFESDQPYHRVYETIVKRARECYDGGGVLDRLTVNGDLHPKVKMAVVTIYTVTRIISTATNNVSADIEAVSDDLTKVTVYHDGTHRFIAENMAKWVVYGSTNCGQTE